MTPLVSFVVPCYNLAHLLPECIHSILAQTYHNFEILIMDNCSPDDTPQVAQSFNDPRVRHIRNESNIGHIPNFNKGITLSRGDYIWWISPDDKLSTSHALERYVDFMERNGEVGYAFCRCLEIQGDVLGGIADWTDCGNEDILWRDRKFLPRLIESNCISLSSGIVRRCCYEKVGLFATDLIYAADWYLWCRMAMHYDVAYFAEPMVCWRNHKQMMTASFSGEKVKVRIGEEIEILWRISNQIQGDDAESLKSLCRAQLVQQGLDRLNQGPTGCEARSLSGTELRKLLRSRLTDPQEFRTIQSAIYSTLFNYAEYQFWRGEHAEAAELYYRAFGIQPGGGVLIKYFMLRTGAPGLLVRKLYRRLRWGQANSQLRMNQAAAINNGQSHERQGGPER